MRRTTTVLMGTLLWVVAASGIPGETETPGEDGASVWSPELQMRFHRVDDVTVSPDGSRIAFVVREPIMDEETSEFRSQVWVARADGSDTRQYTYREQSSTAPEFSPDGRFLGFLSNKGNGKDASGDDGPRAQVWVMAVDGGEAREITAGDGAVTAFGWSPDGQTLAFLMTDPKTEEEKEARKEKRDVELVDQNLKYGRLYVLPFDPTASEAEAKLLTEADVHVTGFDWSPDAREIVFRHQLDPTNSTMDTGDLSIVDLETATVRTLVGWEGDDSQPRWSPDGGTIAFVSQGGPRRTRRPGRRLPRAGRGR